jgi:hypothetical protein
MFYYFVFLFPLRYVEVHSSISSGLKDVAIVLNAFC